MIAFGSDRAGSQDVYVLDIANGRTHRLTRDKERDTSPAWSPDGNKIVFISKRDGKYDVYVMNADGTGVTRVARSPIRRWTQPSADRFLTPPHRLSLH